MRDVTSNSGVKREVSFRERAGRQSPSKAPAAMRAIKESVRRNFWQDDDVVVDRVCIARATRDGSRSHDRGAGARPPFVGIY